MYGCESWTIKKVEHRRIDVFEFWCWRSSWELLETSRRFNQTILKGISPEYSLGGLMLKLKLQYFGHLMQRIDSLEKTLILRKIEGRRGGDDRGQDGWIRSLTLWTWVEQTLGVGDEQGSLMSCSLWRCKESDTTERQYWQPMQMMICPILLFTELFHETKPGSSKGAFVLNSKNLNEEKERRNKILELRF